MTPTRCGCMLVTDNWLIREAGAVNRAPWWHHDAPYFDLDGEWCVLCR